MARIPLNRQDVLSGDSEFMLQTRADELEALAELRRHIRREGLERPSPVLAVAVLAFHLAVMLGGIAVFVASNRLWIDAVAILISTYGALGIGMTGHNASHQAVTGSRRLDRMLMYFTMAVLSGVSATYWRKKHVQLHHAGPNNIGIDTDIDLMPYFALREDEVTGANRWQRKFFAIQHWVFPAAINLTLMNLQSYGIRHLAAELRRSGGRRREIAADVVCLCAHLVAFLLVPMLFWPVASVLGFFLLRQSLISFAMFVSVAPAHFPAEAKLVTAQSAQLSPVACQIYTTLNFRTGFFGRLVCLGSEYQIEHHLLPGCNPLKMAQVSEIVRPFCERHGYPYRQLGWWEGIVKSLDALRVPKHVHAIGELKQAGPGSAGLPPSHPVESATRSIESPVF
jgi:linoleoyl-CoA desaturase